MTAATIYRDFNRSAIASNLSGRQMQLWLKLYEFLHSYRRQDVQLYTPMLLDMLNISLSQFRRARQGLIEAGFLSIRQDSQQHTSYTLLLNGRAISFVPEKSCGTSGAPSPTGIETVCATENHGTGNPSPTGIKTPNPVYAGTETVSATKNHGTGNPSPTGIKPLNPVHAGTETACAIKNPGTGNPYTQAGCSRSQYPSGDIMLNGGYQADLQEFFRSFPDTALSGWLQQWADMRRKNGWTLTRWGLTALLDKLQSLSGGNLQTMAAIVKQSVSRRWKGFYPLKAERKPSGEKLLCMEQQQRSRQPIHQKFKPEQRDLSFLER